TDVGVCCIVFFFFFFSSRRRHTRSYGDWSSDVCSSDLSAKRGWSGTYPRKAVWTTQRAASDGALRTIAGSESKTSPATSVGGSRSEERRVGKECRARGSREGWRKKKVKGERKGCERGE